MAFWIWTPETNRWINPKYAAKDTPQEQLEYAIEFYKAEDYRKALREFEKLIRHFPKARQAAEAMYYIGLCHLEMEAYVAAFKAFQSVLDKYPFSDRAKEVVAKQYEIGNILMEGGGRRNKVLRAVVGADYDVIEIFRTVIRNAPYGPYAAPSQYKIGLYLMEKQMYFEARDEFERTVNDYPQTEWAKAAQYQIALADSKRSSQPGYEQKVTEAAIAQFKDFVTKNPDAEFTEEARMQINELREKEAENNFVIGQFYEKQRRYEAARIYYTSIIQHYSNTSWAKKAMNRIKRLPE